jgi:hypothetical protein
MPPTKENASITISLSAFCFAFAACTSLSFERLPVSTPDPVDVNLPLAQLEIVFPLEVTIHQRMRVHVQPVFEIL